MISAAASIRGRLMANISTVATSKIRTIIRSMDVLPDKSISPAPQLAGTNNKKKCASDIFIVHGVPLFQRLGPTLASAAGSLFDLFQAPALVPRILPLTIVVSTVKYPHGSWVWIGRAVINIKIAVRTAG